MELKEFISETLKQINDGLRDGSEYIQEKGGDGAHNRPFNVAFDVALTTNNEETLAKGGKITVASIFQAGAEKEKTAATTNYSRIQFTVPVHVIPYKKSV